MDFETEPTIYEKMAQEKIKVACACVRVLSYYDSDPENTFKKLELIYNSARRAIMDEQSEMTLDLMDRIILRFGEQINRYRKVYPGMEKNSGALRKKLRDLEKLL